MKWTKPVAMLGMAGLLGCTRPNPNYGRCPAGMIHVPGGTFMMGSDTGDPGEKPAHEETVGSFCLDETEVTVAAFRPCVEKDRCLAPSSGGNCNWNVSGREDHPINCVTFDQADYYCDRAGKRLPTEIEWEYAARGSVGSPYAWGADAPSEALLCWGGQTARKSTCPAGQYPPTLLGVQVPPGRGAHDLGGNVGEWMDSFSCAYTAPDRGAPDCGIKADMAGAVVSRMIRGASWTFNNAAEVLATRRFSLGSAAQVDNLGFRCAAAAKPY